MRELRRSILVVDDDHAERENLCDLLQSVGYDAIGVPNGVHALNLLQSGAPSLILLDLLMPEKDGWQVLYELRRLPRCAGVPVVILSAMPKQGLNGARVQGYLEKPFEINDLLAEVRRQVA